MSNVQVTIRQTYFSKFVANVTNWQFPNTTATTYQEFADALRASYVTNVVADMSNNWDLDDIDLRIFDGNPPFTTRQSFTSGKLTGTNTNHFLPRQVALLVRLVYTQGRPNRGRVFFPGLTEAPSDEGSWDTLTLGRYVTLVNAWKNGLSTTAGSCFLRIARPNFVTNVWTLDNPVESAQGVSPAATIRNRR